jgi:hypothetical protein
MFEPFMSFNIFFTIDSGFGELAFGKLQLGAAILFLSPVDDVECFLSGCFLC